MTSQEFIARADAVLSRLESLIRTPMDRRQEAVPDDLLLAAVRGVKTMREAVETGSLPRWTLPANRRGRSLTRLFADCFDHHLWPRTGKLIEEVEELENEYVTM